MSLAHFGVGMFAIVRAASRATDEKDVALKPGAASPSPGMISICQRPRCARSDTMRSKHDAGHPGGPAGGDPEAAKGAITGCSRPTKSGRDSVNSARDLFVAMGNRWATTPGACASSTTLVRYIWLGALVMAIAVLSQPRIAATGQTCVAVADPSRRRRRRLRNRSPD